MVWQLLQVRKLERRRSILVGPMWQGLVDWHKAAMLRPDFGLASEQDLAIPHCVPGAKEALAILRENHAAWQRERADSAS